MIKRNIAMSLLFLLTCVFGCSRADSPCPPGILTVGAAEADEALLKRAQKQVGEGKGQDVAATFDCGYDEVSPGMYRNIKPIQLTFADVLVCVAITATQAMSLTDCMQAAARAKMAGSQFWKEPGKDAMSKAIEKTKCSEVSREGEVAAEKHDLNRIAGQDLVQVLLLAGAQLADKAGKWRGPWPLRACS